MTINLVNEGEQLVAQLSGRLDTAAAVAVAPDFQTLAEQASKHIILDCTQLEYISSSGLRIFLSIRKEAAAKGSKVIVRSINDDIRQVFVMTGFISLFEIQ